MPNTYTQLHIHIVFAVQNRNSLITENIRERVEKYMSGIIDHKKQKLLAIYSMPDHTHLLIGIQPSIAISDLVKEIKTSTTNFINTEKLVTSKFAWQEGFGAFACSKSHTAHTIDYILKQSEKHKQKSFKEEYISFLKHYEIEYDEKYLFEWIM